MADQTLSIQLATPVYDHRAQHITFYSSALDIYKSFYIFVPADIAPGQHVPSLYLLRGHEREWINYHEDDSRGSTNIIDIYEQLRQNGQIGPIILVFPGLSSNDNHIPSLLTNMHSPELAGNRLGIGSGRFEDYFFHDLIPFVDAVFPTIPDRVQRGMVGFSLGGAMVMKAAAQRSDLFATACSYDGTILYALNKGRRIRGTDRILEHPMLGPAYGFPRDLDFIADNSPATLILRGDTTMLQQVTWLVGYGPRQSEPWQANFYRGEHLLRCLRAHGIENALPHREFPNGDHTWRSADAFMKLALPILDRVFRKS
ncbi:MAG: esterase [Chloroflexi bacterium AL-W]|nr:esterase [Chloroflexi bacterium AL-N1]NOK65890.1 esterase [Chloroflexi bacterium AL-N10]NOK72771.1 esterase [Chloroflexi bacterium AL-N5]NOK79668.1 esterase [Chloroflexi bacterium AL-W]NOK92993.1 esterase [Chloroflexi bacterium AL-N15]